MRVETTKEITNPAITRFAPVIGIGVGIVFIAMGFSAHAKQQTYLTTTATVTEVFVIPGVDITDPDRITPTIEYEVDGQTYTTTLAEGQKAYEIGDQIAIQYDPQDPHRTIDPQPVGPWLLVILGVIFIGTGIATRSPKYPAGNQRPA